MTKLIPLDTERDATLVAGWINTPGGAQMLQLMGVAVPDDFTTTTRDELKTLQTIIDDPNEIAWMIEHDGRVVGIVEVHTVPFEGLPAPNTSIMIGDVSARGKGVGTAANMLMLDYLKNQSYKNVFARVLLHNVASLRMMDKVGFMKLDAPYSDGDGLNWQNYSYAYGEL